MSRIDAPDYPDAGVETPPPSFSSVDAVQSDTTESVREIVGEPLGKVAECDHSYQAIADVTFTPCGQTEPMTLKKGEYVFVVGVRHDFINVRANSQYFAIPIGDAHALQVKHMGAARRRGFSDTNWS